jgi:5-methylcytosine-specific restriction endonuclease McrBC GTP-binding regulatory subunit McrB
MGFSYKLESYENRSKHYVLSSREDIKRYAQYLAIQIQKNANMYEQLDSLNEHTSIERRNTLKPTWQDFSALNFVNCGFTGVIIVILNSY